jgi:hypothetical protein
MKVLLILSLISFVIVTKSEKISLKNETIEFSSESGKSYGVLHYESLVVELSKIASENDFAASECKAELVEFRKGVQTSEVWAFKSK